MVGEFLGDFKEFGYTEKTPAHLAGYGREGGRVLSLVQGFGRD